MGSVYAIPCPRPDLVRRRADVLVAPGIAIGSRHERISLALEIGDD